MAEREITNRLELKQKLKDPRPALEAIGALGVGHSQRAFLERRLGNKHWLRRYPGMAEPFINVAGALSDLNRGRAIKSRRFQRQPVLRDTGQLFNSISWRVTSSTTVEIGVSSGPAKEYAGRMQTGGESTQPVTQAAKAKLAEEYAKADGAKKKTLSERLGFLFAPSVTSLETEAVARPFVGITDQLETEIKGLVARFVES